MSRHMAMTPLARATYDVSPSRRPSHLLDVTEQRLPSGNGSIRVLVLFKHFSPVPY